MITGGCHAAASPVPPGEIAEVMAYSASRGPISITPRPMSPRVKFRDGGVGKISASLDGPPFPYQFNIDPPGSRGAIRTTGSSRGSFFPIRRTGRSCPARPRIPARPCHTIPSRRKSTNLADCIAGGGPVLSDVIDACRSMEVALAVTESAASGKPVGISAE